MASIKTVSLKAPEDSSNLRNPAKKLVASIEALVVELPVKERSMVILVSAIVAANLARLFGLVISNNLQFGHPSAPASGSKCSIALQGFPFTPMMGSLGEGELNIHSWDTPVLDSTSFASFSQLGLIPHSTFLIRLEERPSQLAKPWLLENPRRPNSSGVALNDSRIRLIGCSAIMADMLFSMSATNPKSTEI